MPILVLTGALAAVAVMIMPQAVAMEQLGKVTMEEVPIALATALVAVAVALAKQAVTQPTNQELLGEGEMVVMA
jgi:hypothetical protein